MQSNPASPMRTRDAAAFLAVMAGVAAPWLTAASSVPWWMGAATLGLGLALAILSAIDVETQRLPDTLTLPLIAFGVVMPALIDRHAILWHVAGAALGYLALWAVAQAYQAYRGHPGLGMGDAKLMAAAGAWLGPAGLPNVLMIAAFAALAAVGIAWWRGVDVTARTAIPFGPFLALGFWATWLYGPLL